MAVRVRKTRVMIADELATHLGTVAWEREALRRLGYRTLARLATLAVPGWDAYVDVPTNSRAPTVTE